MWRYGGFPISTEYAILNFMDNPAPFAEPKDRSSLPVPDRRRTELVRKALHFLIALSPPMAGCNRAYTLIFLGAGTLAYVGMEALRCRGLRIPLISFLTVFASRRRDRGRFVLGPVTLGVGAFLSLLLFPPQVAAIAIYALAFGDGTASLAGKFFGRIRPPFLFHKSLEGSVACFLGAFVSAWLVSGDLRTALTAAGAATAAELLPIRDWDNIIVPLVTGAAVRFLL
ncbi:MAG: SEC59/DGK1/VTE5 family protein [Spirochaetaceae bacterium]|jgi:dolichol kinase|nr:SEC59/DGK1/VTE5 family protein [Spirochaetaceae bacterium]